MTTLTYGYKVGLKHQIVDALKAVFGPTLPDPRYRDIYVGLEYPLEQIDYSPGAIYVSYSEGPIQNVGVGNIETDVDRNGVPIKYKHFRFEGAVNFNILALTTVDRDNLTAILMNLLAFGQDIPEFEPFFARVSDEKFVPVQLMTELITPSGEQVGTAPWGTEDEQVYGNAYQVNLYGEFWADASTGDLIEIEAVDLFPYRNDQPPPW